MSNRYPKLVAFDLDYTLWDLWIDTHISGPLKREEGKINEITDRYQNTISFYPQVSDILNRLRIGGTTIAACSRTSATKLAREALSLLLIAPPRSEPEASPLPAIQYFNETEIYPGSKLSHFKRLHEKTGLPYSEMLFFDDEHRNKEVERLGVTFCLVESGMDEYTFEQGLAEWKRRHPDEVNEEEDVDLVNDSV